MQRRKFEFPLTFSRTSWIIEYNIIGTKKYPCNKETCTDYDPKNDAMLRG